MATEPVIGNLDFKINGRSLHPLYLQPLRLFYVFSICGLFFFVSLQADFLSWFGLQLRYDSIFLPVGAAGFFFLLSRLPYTFAITGVSLFSVTLCGLVLLGVWNNYISDLATIAGLYPHSDGRSYLEGSLNLLYNHELGPFASRRPLSIVFWAFLLAIGGGNIKVGMALMVFICAIVMGNLAQLVIRAYGWVAGYVVLLTLFLFYRRFVGTYLTEHLGLVLGCLGFVFLIQSIYSHRKVLAAAGLFLLALALNARAGAFFILPALALWMGLHWRGQKRISLKAFTIACFVVLLGFGLNSLSLRYLGQPGASQGNFAYTLYGLVHGGNWTQVRKDHPELLLLPEEERHREIFNLALSRIQEQPLSLVSGAVRAYKAFFFSSQGPYSFILFSLQRSILKYPPNLDKVSVINILAIWQTFWDNPIKYLQIVATFSTYAVLFIFTILGWLFLFKYLITARWLLVFGWGGILLSIPFIPPWDVDLMRVHAATIPFLVVIPAFGIKYLFSRSHKRESLSFSCQINTKWQYGVLLLPVSILFLFAFLPMVFKPKPDSFHAQEMFCQDGERSWVLHFVPGSMISIHPEGEKQRLTRNTTTMSNIKENMGILSLNKPIKTNAFETFTPDSILMLGYERNNGRMRYLVCQDQQCARDHVPWVKVCVTPLYRDENTTWWLINRLHQNATNYGAK